MSAVVPPAGPVGSVGAAGKPAVGDPEWWAPAAAYAYAKHDQEVLMDKEELRGPCDHRQCTRQGCACLLE